MEANRETTWYDMNVVIVKQGLGSKVLALAKELGISGGTVLMGRGTVKNALLEFLELAESHKEIVVLLARRSVGEPFLREVSRVYRFKKRNHGIAFSIPVSAIMGTKGSMGSTMDICKGEEEMSEYQSIYVIVDKGNAEMVVEAATAAGARGGTIVNARGSGIHETSKIFAMEIEPEKEMVLMLVEADITEAVCRSIKERMDIDAPGRGILFVQNVHQAMGLY